jgi:hypothetical protein
MLLHHDVLTDDAPVPRRIADREPFVLSVGSAF